MKPKKQTKSNARRTTPQPSPRPTVASLLRRPSLRKHLILSLRIIAMVMVLGVAPASFFHYVYGPRLRYRMHAKAGMKAFQEKRWGEAETELLAAAMIVQDAYVRQRSRAWKSFEWESVLNTLALTYEAERKYSKIVEFYRIAMPFIIDDFGEYNVRLVPSYSIMARVLATLGQNTDAKNFYKETIAILTNTYGPKDQRVVGLTQEYSAFLKKIEHKKETGQVETKPALTPLAQQTPPAPRTPPAETMPSAARTPSASNNQTGSLELGTPQFSSSPAKDKLPPPKHIPGKSP